MVIKPAEIGEIDESFIDDVTHIGCEEDFWEEWGFFCDLCKELGMESVLDKPRVLDLGCRYSVFIRYLIKKKIAESAFGVDVDPKFSKMFSGLVSHAPAHELPFEDGQFNIVTANSVFDLNLYPLAPVDILETFKEVSRVLVSGGVFFISTHIPPQVNWFASEAGFRATGDDENTCAFLVKE